MSLSSEPQSEPSLKKSLSSEEVIADIRTFIDSDDLQYEVWELIFETKLADSKKNLADIIYSKKALEEILKKYASLSPKLRSVLVSQLGEVTTEEEILAILHNDTAPEGRMPDFKLYKDLPMGMTSFFDLIEELKVIMAKKNIHWTYDLIEGFKEFVLSRGFEDELKKMPVSDYFKLGLISADEFLDLEIRKKIQLMIAVNDEVMENYGKIDDAIKEIFPEQKQKESSIHHCESFDEMTKFLLESGDEVKLEDSIYQIIDFFGAKNIQWDDAKITSFNKTIWNIAYNTKKGDDAQSYFSYIRQDKFWPPEIVETFAKAFELDTGK